MDHQPRTVAVVVVVGLICGELGYQFAAPALRARESGGLAAGPVEGFRAATIDMALLYKGDPKFVELREALTIQTQQAEGELRSRNERQETKKQQLTRLSPNSEAFRKMKSELEIEAALLQTWVQEQKTSLDKRESEIYWTCYQDMARLIEEHCQQHDIQMVVRTVKEAIDPQNVQDVAKELNRQVVYDKGIDITGPILERLQELRAGEQP